MTPELRKQMQENLKQQAFDFYDKIPQLQVLKRGWEDIDAFYCKLKQFNERLNLFQKILDDIKNKTIKNMVQPETYYYRGQRFVCQDDIPRDLFVYENYTHINSSLDKDFAKQKKDITSFLKDWTATIQPQLRQLESLPCKLRQIQEDSKAIDNVLGHLFTVRYGENFVNLINVYIQNNSQNILRSFKIFEIQKDIDALAALNDLPWSEQDFVSVDGTESNYQKWLNSMYSILEQLLVMLNINIKKDQNSIEAYCGDYLMPFTKMFNPMKVGYYHQPYKCLIHKEIENFWKQFYLAQSHFKEPILQDYLQYMRLHKNEAYQQVSGHEERYLKIFMAAANEQFEQIRKSNSKGKNYDYTPYKEVRVLTCESFIQTLNLSLERKKQLINWYICPNQQYLDEATKFFLEEVTIEADDNSKSFKKFISDWVQSSMRNRYRRGILLSVIALIQSEKNIFDLVALSEFNSLITKDNDFLQKSVSAFSDLSVVQFDKCGAYKPNTIHIQLDKDKFKEVAAGETTLQDAEAFVFLQDSTNPFVKKYMKELSKNQKLGMGRWFIPIFRTFDHELGHFILYWVNRFNENYFDHSDAQGDVVPILYDVMWERKDLDGSIQPIKESDFSVISVFGGETNGFCEQEQILGMTRNFLNGQKVLCLNFLTGEWSGDTYEGLPSRFDHNAISISTKDQRRPTKIYYMLKDYFTRKHLFEYLWHKTDTGKTTCLKFSTDLSAENSGTVTSIEPKRKAFRIIKICKTEDNREHIKQDIEKICFNPHHQDFEILDD